MSSSSPSNQDEVLFVEDLLAEQRSVDHQKSTGYNYSTIGFIHSKLHKSLGKDRADKFVYIKSNANSNNNNEWNDDQDFGVPNDNSHNLHSTLPHIKRFILLDSDDKEEEEMFAASCL